MSQSSPANCPSHAAAAPWVYSDLVKDHFLSPRNFLMGDESAYRYDAVGTVGNPICGDQMRMFLQIQDGRIADVKWKTYGCASAIASTSMMSEMASVALEACTIIVTMAPTAQNIRIEMKPSWVYEVRNSKISGLLFRSGTEWFR